MHRVWNLLAGGGRPVRATDESLHPYRRMGIPDDVQTTTVMLRGCLQRQLAELLGGDQT